MADEKKDLEELTQEIRKTIESNKIFLQRIFDEDFEAEDQEDGENSAYEEL